MNPTKQFAWKDRETAGHDLIQLAYYAPPYISNRALELLSAIRAEGIVPELVSITLDSHRSYWHRVYSLRAIRETKNNFFFPELETLARQAFDDRIAKFRDIGETYFDIHIQDLLPEINGFAEEHPVNREWFLNLIDTIEEPRILPHFLAHASLFNPLGDYRQDLSNRLRSVLDKHPELISLSHISRFYEENPEWCEKHFEMALKVCLREARVARVVLLAQKWDKLRETLIRNIEGWEIFYYERLAEFNKKRELTPKTPSVENFLGGCYLSALEGNQRAYFSLIKAARLWKGFIPFRAVATHYLGKLQDKYDVFPILSRLALYADDDWGDSDLPFSPIRYEAGRALSKKPSAGAWETIVEAFFINPRNELSRCQLQWISYMTDVLNGDIEQEPVIERDSDTQTIWFRALADVSKEDAEEMLKSVL